MNKESKILILIALGTIAILFGGSLLFNKADNADTQTETKVVDSSLLVSSDSSLKGPENAAVTIVEFGDFQCPACALSEPTVEKVLTDYGDKVKFVFRHFPLEQHKNAFYAAQASEAANEQGKFWEMHNILYAKQEQWGERDNAKELIDGYAKELGLNMDQFTKSISDKKFDAKINKGITDGIAAGVNATPTFFVNGKKQSILNYTEWKTLLDSELTNTSNGSN